MDISKLPKWVQRHIKNLERQREVAVKALNDYCDDQTKSPFSIEDNVCTGEEKGPTNKVRYIQTHKISVENEGVYLEVMIWDRAIDLSWSSERSWTGEVACIPYSYQQIHLVSKDNMR